MTGGIYPRCAKARASASAGHVCDRALLSTLRDRVGQGRQALGTDWALDGTMTFTASGRRTITFLELDSHTTTGASIGVWDTDSGSTDYYWVLGTVTSPDGALVNNLRNMTVNFVVANRSNFVLFATDLNGIESLPGNTLTVTAIFSDGTTATVVTTLP